jgi:hypothetical protein
MVPSHNTLEPNATLVRFRRLAPRTSLGVQKADGIVGAKISFLFNFEYKRILGPSIPFNFVAPKLAVRGKCLARP